MARITCDKCGLYAVAVAGGGEGVALSGVGYTGMPEGVNCMAGIDDSDVDTAYPWHGWRARECPDLDKRSAFLLTEMEKNNGT